MQAKFFFRYFILSYVTINIIIYIYWKVNDSKVIANYSLIIMNNKTSRTDTVKEIVTDIKDDVDNDSEMKYILKWTSPKDVPFNYMGFGRETFLKRGCKFTNCYVTPDRNYFPKLTRFDVIAFSGPEVTYLTREKLPQDRASHQKYVFASIESPCFYSVCNEIYDGYFNWTWTYKLDSEVRWGYIVVRDTAGNIIGPNKEMHWIKTEDMEPVSMELMSVLRKKSRFAAWFVSNCHTPSRRETYIKDFQKYIKKFGFKVDIFGKCGELVCYRSEEAICNRMIERDYYFYMAFENSFAEDYVTEKVIRGLQNSAIPVVYGGANYTRFMPEGAYINANDLEPSALGDMMIELKNNITKFSEYFKWRNHYSIHKQGATEDTDEYCAMCALLNDEKKLKRTSVYYELRKWWNNPDENCNMSIAS